MRPRIWVPMVMLVLVFLSLVVACGNGGGY